ncbi:unnamed protein product, partial [Adineta steineri]
MKENGLCTKTIKSKIEKLNHDQYSVLHYAIRYNHLNLCRKFIEEFHCDINLAGYNGETSLHTAARYDISDNLSSVDFLISYQADLCKRDNYGEQIEKFLFLIFSLGRTPLHHAAMRNNYINAQQLIKFGAIIDIFDRKNATPLHFACRFNAIDCVRLFLVHQTIIDRQDAGGNTPLHCIALSQQIIENHI